MRLARTAGGGGGGGGRLGPGAAAPIWGGSGARSRTGGAHHGVWELGCPPCTNPDPPGLCLQGRGCPTAPRTGGWVTPSLGCLGEKLLQWAPCGSPAAGPQPRVKRAEGPSVGREGSSARTQHPAALRVPRALACAASGSLPPC